MNSSHPVTRRTALSVIAVGTAGAALVACSGNGDPAKKSDENQPVAPADPVANLKFEPADAATDVGVLVKAAVTVTDGYLNPDVRLLNDAGTAVTGELSDDRKTFTITEVLGYGKKYTWAGSATGTDRLVVNLKGSFTTLNPQAQTNVVLNIGDGQEVGIAAPLILTFDAVVQDKAAVEKALSITTEPKTEGSWGWLPEDGGSRVHWRTAEYYQPGTKVSFNGKFYGLNYGGGAYGASDMSVDFVIGRSQIVKADATSHQIVVVNGGAVTMTLPCSYGEADLDRNVTRSGVHVVSEKLLDVLMSNAAAGYFNVRERFAVRISNNGEFIHANPQTVGVQGSSNVTNGCINLSLGDAEAYYNTAIYGDPVEVTGTRIQLSAADGDIYDWSMDYGTWKTLSALTGN